MDQQTLGAIEGGVGNSVIANIELMAIENATPGAEFEAIWRRLHDRVFAAPDIASPQRLFIMRRMKEIVPDGIDSRRFEAEALAMEYVSRGDFASKPWLHQAKSMDLWQRATPNGRLTLILKTADICRWGAKAISGSDLPDDIAVELIPPADLKSTNQNIVLLPMGASMPGWQLLLSHRDDPSVSSGFQNVSIHIWTGALLVLFSSVLGIAIARTFQRRLRLANLKNDLVGTVSHELKTPLASMRLLVETLLDEEHPDEQTTREYLQLIDKENVRLSRLIENFLTFSRMEHDRHTFRFDDVAIEGVIDEAIDANGDRLHGPDCDLNLEIESDLPALWGDRDALVTVVMNLVDNAYKYSNSPRRIDVSATRHPEGICLTVTDNGIGLPKTATKRIFERFFQVDQSLVRKGQGCGLGLSIVDFIIRAHHGTIQVNSILNQGSTFQIMLPVATENTQEAPQ